MIRHVFYNPRDRNSLVAILADAPEHVELHPWSTAPSIEAANMALLQSLGASLSRLPVVLDDDDPQPQAIVQWEDRAYLGSVFVFDQGDIWENRLPASTPNIWRPGVLNSGWVRFVEAGVEEPWVADRQYLKTVVVTGNGRRYLALADEFSEVGREPWNPVMFAVWEDIGSDGSVPATPAWVQPTGAHDAYGLGDIVTHNGQTWESTNAANVWEPGVFGWVIYE